MTSFDRALRKAYRKPTSAASGPETADASQRASAFAAASQEAERDFASGAWYRLEGAVAAEDRPAPSLRRRVVSTRRRTSAAVAEEASSASVGSSSSAAWRTLERRSQELLSAQDDLSRLERQIADRESALSEAEADLHATIARVQEREETLAQRERLLRDREGLIESKERELSRSSQELAERAARLERERGELQSLQSDLKRRSDAIRDAQATVESEKLSLKQRHDALAAQQATLEAQRAELAAQKRALAEHERSMGDHHRDLDENRHQIQRQREELSEQKELVERQRAELEASLESWQAASLERDLREAAIEEKERGIQSRQEDVAAQQSRLKQREAELRLRQSALSEREAERESQEAKLRQQTESYRDHEVAFSTMRERFEEQQAQLVARTEELARRQDELDRETIVAIAAASAAPEKDASSVAPRGAVYDAGSDIVEKIRATESLRSAPPTAPTERAAAKPAGTNYRIDVPQASAFAGPHKPVNELRQDEADFVDEADDAESVATTVEANSGDETLRPMWEVDEFDWPPICRMLTQTEGDQFAALGQAIVDCARQGKKLWGVTSLDGQVGKTTLSLCLAAWLGQQQHDVLLIDGNFTHSEIAERLGISGQTCWRRTIDGSLPWGEVTIASVKDHLSVAPLARQSGGPDVTLLDPRVQQALQVAASAYDVVLIDLPTMPSQSLRHRKLPFEACLIVTQGETTSRDSLMRAADQLRKAGIDPVAVAENG